MISSKKLLACFTFLLVSLPLIAQKPYSHDPIKMIAENNVILFAQSNSQLEMLKQGILNEQIPQGSALAASCKTFVEIIDFCLSLNTFLNQKFDDTIAQQEIVELKRLEKHFFALKNKIKKEKNPEAKTVFEFQMMHIDKATQSFNLAGVKFRKKFEKLIFSLETNDEKLIMQAIQDMKRHSPVFFKTEIDKGKTFLMDLFISLKEANLSDRGLKLLIKESDPYAEDHKGKSALYYAMQANKDTCVRFLLADILKNKDQKLKTNLLRKAFEWAHLLKKDTLCTAIEKLIRNFLFHEIPPQTLQQIQALRVYEENQNKQPQPLSPLASAPEKQKDTAKKKQRELKREKLIQANERHAQADREAQEVLSKKPLLERENENSTSGSGSMASAQALAQEALLKEEEIQAKIALANAQAARAKTLARLQSTHSSNKRSSLCNDDDAVPQSPSAGNQKKAATDKKTAEQKKHNTLKPIVRAGTNKLSVPAPLIEQGTLPLPLLERLALIQKPFAIPAFKYRQVFEQ